METLREQLARQEEARDKPYDDATGKELKQGDMLKGKLTIGIGWNLSDVPLPKEVINLMLDISLENVERDLRERLLWVFNMDPVRLDVIRNLCFNMGISKLLGFRNMLNFARLAMTTGSEGDWSTAADNLKDSVWYNQVGERGVELVEQLRTGKRR